MEGNVARFLGLAGSMSPSQLQCDNCMGKLKLLWFGFPRAESPLQK